VNRSEQHPGLDVVIAGLAVVDIIGKPVDLEHPPKKGGLQVIDTIKMTTGGNVSNVGIDLCKRGSKVGAVTRIGNDSLGKVLLQQYEEHGMDCSGITTDDRAQTSATIVSVDERGERTFLHTRGAVANFRRADIERHLDLINRSSFLVVGYLGLMQELEPELPGLLQAVKKANNIPIFLDTGGVPQRMEKKQLNELLSAVDYFIPSLEEAIALTGKQTPEEITTFLADAAGQKTYGVKLGEQGCYIATASRSGIVPPKHVKAVVDTTGAGDAFVSGFVAATLRGHDPFEAARLGNAIAASCVTALGASTAIRAFEEYSA